MNIRLYLRQSFMLLFGNGAAQLINLASYVILARLYAPGEFGGFALFMTVVGVFGPIACGRFDLIIQSAPDRQLVARTYCSLALSHSQACSSRQPAGKSA